MSLPTDAKERKGVPIVTGVLDYFPDAIAEVARVSLAGNDQHHPGAPLHWDKSKSSDEADALGRHLIERGTRDKDGQRHSAKVAWRALALLQREIDAEKAAVKEKDDQLDAQIHYFEHISLPHLFPERPPLILEPDPATPGLYKAPTISMKVSTVYPTCARCGDLILTAQAYEDMEKNRYCSKECLEAPTYTRWGV